MDAPIILVVDDSRTIRGTLQKQLEDIGATVVLAVDGQKGYEAAVSRPFDLIISDVEMPVMDGFTLCRKLKAHPATQAVPVIILSTLDTEEDIDRGFGTGASAYVVKNRASRELIPMVKEILGRANLLHNRLFMIVDDSRLIRSTLEESLLQAGFRVVSAENGRQALDLLRTHSPDIIVSDMHMPVMAGAEFCEAVRAMEPHGDVPFVAMSSEADRRVMREMVHLGASAYLIKPFHPEQLIILAEKLLSDHVRLLLQEKKTLVTERNSLLSGIASLIAALEARDVYTRGHSEAVADLSRDIGLRLGLEPRDLDSLCLAAKLHDIGKIGIRDDILLKPGKLSPGEFEIIKGHVLIGVEILGPIASMAPLLPAILHHHEKFDGSGYPHGLKGEAIPLNARIIAVADVFHALSSDRPYRKAFAPHEVLTAMDLASGSHLCPVCTAALFQSLKGTR
jgi:response regulator RpfG family c-di-GMP phosphodiesterase